MFLGVEEGFTGACERGVVECGLPRPLYLTSGLGRQILDFSEKNQKQRKMEQGRQQGTN